MGGDKLLLLYKGKSLLQLAVDLLSGLPVYERILVTTRARLDTVVLPDDVRVVINPRPESGQSGSIRLGVSAALGQWYFFMAADQPGLVAGDLLPLLGCAGCGKDAIVYPVVNGCPCSPTLFSSSFRAELLALSGDVGGRSVRDAHPEACIAVEPERPGNFLDIDNMEDYMRLMLNA